MNEVVSPERMKIREMLQETLRDVEIHGLTFLNKLGMSDQILEDCLLLLEEREHARDAGNCGFEKPVLPGPLGS